MKTKLFDYNLPQEMIAQKPAKPRDGSRLMVLDRKSGRIVGHHHFFDLPKFLRKGDVLIFNDTKVFKARLLGKLNPTSARDPSAALGMTRVEIFLLRPIDKNTWEALGRPGKKLKIGSQIKFAKNFSCKVIKKFDDGRLEVKFSMPADKVVALANRYGHIPVPPYIKNEPAALSEYQSIMAQKTGSVAAPTASFHFTPRLIKKIKQKGVEIIKITLHVGIGTFRPMQTENIEDHIMHEEWVDISTTAAKKINEAKNKGERVIAVGTTVTRALEGCALSVIASTDKIGMEQSKIATSFASLTPRNDTLPPFQGPVNIFIKPGFKFRIIDGLITNFHLPQSTLLVLVSTFLGSRPKLIHAYRKAILLKYRFFSFGDGMLIL